MTPTQLAELQTRLGFTNQQMADAIGCAFSTFRKWKGLPDKDAPIPMLDVYARNLAQLVRRS